MLVRCEACGKPLYVPSVGDARSVECSYCYTQQRVSAMRETLSPGGLDWALRLRRHAVTMRPGEAALLLLGKMQDDGYVAQRKELCASVAQLGREKAAALEPRVTAATTVEELAALRKELAGVPGCTEMDTLRTYLTERTAELRARRIRKARQVHLAVAVLVTLALVVFALL